MANADEHLRNLLDIVRKLKLHEKKENTKVVADSTVFLARKHGEPGNEAEARELVRKLLDIIGEQDVGKGRFFVDNAVDYVTDPDEDTDDKDDSDDLEEEDEKPTPPSPPKTVFRTTTPTPTVFPGDKPK